MTVLYLRSLRIVVGALYRLALWMQPVFPDLPRRLSVWIGSLGKLRRFAHRYLSAANVLLRRVHPSMPTELVKILAELGVGKGDTLLLIVDEASLAGALPPPRFGAILGNSFQARLLSAVLELLSERGTLVMPCDSVEDPKKLAHRRRLYDAKRSMASGLSGRFQRQPGVFRSEAPLMSLAACGDSAAELMRGQLDAAPFPMGLNSPWAKLLSRNAKVAVVGRALAGNLSLLLPIHLDNAAYSRPAFFHRPYRFNVMNDYGRAVEVDFHIHASPFQAEYNLANFADYDIFSKYLDDKYGIYKKAKLGNVDVAVFSYAEQYAVLRSEMSANIFLDDARYWRDGRPTDFGAGK
jgi:hypothetical protein